MFGKLLCVAALASVVLTQAIIALPAEGTDVTAGAAMTIQLEIPTATAAGEVAVAIGVYPCFGGTCPNDGLGSLLYVGPFDPQSTNGAGNLYENITVIAPSYFDGKMLLSVAHFYLQGERTNNPELQLTNTTLNLVGASG